MRGIVLCVGMLLAWPLAGQAAEPAAPTSVEFGAGAWVDVDATGKAHVVEMDKLRRFKDDGKPGSIADIIKARLRERIEIWEFTPPTKNGVAVSGKTHVDVRLQAYVAESGGMGLRIESASTGMAVRKRSSYLPLTDELGLSNTWWINVHLKVGPEGRVVDARIQDSSLFHGKGAITQVPPRVAKGIREMFEGYEFDVESVDGVPIAGEAIQPIMACASISACNNNMAGMQSDEQDEKSDLAVVDPAVRLRTAVAETIL